MTEEEWLKQLFEGLSRSSFRRRFHLKEQDREYVRQKGMDTIRQHAWTGNKPLCVGIRSLSPSMPRPPAAEGAWKNGIRSEKGES